MNGSRAAARACLISLLLVASLLAHRLLHFDLIKLFFFFPSKTRLVDRSALFQQQLLFSAARLVAVVQAAWEPAAHCLAALGTRSRDPNGTN